MRKKRRESKEKLLKPGAGNNGRNKQQPAGQIFCWLGLADLSSQLVEDQICLAMRPSRWNK